MSRRRLPPGTLKSLIDAHYPQVLWCESHLTCKQGFPKSVHHMGRVDSFGRLHYDRGGVKPRVDGVYRALRLVALAVNRPMRFEPWAVQQYHMSTWAHYELFRKYHRMSDPRWTRGIRRRVAKKKGLSNKIRFWARYHDT